MEGSFKTQGEFSPYAALILSFESCHRLQVRESNKTSYLLLQDVKRRYCIYCMYSISVMLFSILEAHHLWQSTKYWTFTHITWFIDFINSHPSGLLIYHNNIVPLGLIVGRFERSYKLRGFPGGCLGLTKTKCYQCINVESWFCLFALQTCLSKISVTLLRLDLNAE